MGKRKGAPGISDSQGKDKVSRTGEKEGGSDEKLLNTKKISEVKGKLMSLFKKQEDIGGVEDIDNDEDGIRKAPDDSIASGENYLETIDGEKKSGVVTVSTGPIISDDTIVAMIEGRYVRGLHGDGPTLEEQETARALSLAEPYDPGQMYERISAMDSAFSDLRLTEFFSELPSKRMLMQYVDRINLLDLIEELRNHFCFPRNLEKIACIFKNFVASDFEQGILKRSIKEHHMIYEKALRFFCYGDAHTRMLELSAAVNRKLIADPLLSEEDVLRAEQIRMEGIVSRHQLALRNSVANMKRLKTKFKKALLNSEESQRRKHIIELLLEDNVKSQEQTRLKGLAFSNDLVEDNNDGDESNPEVFIIICMLCCNLLRIYLSFI